MNNDGWGFLGAGASDSRIAGKDLQHYRQARTADENPTGRRRVVRQEAQGGGPMKEHMDKAHHHEHHAHHGHHAHPMHHHLEEEKNRHAEAMEHHHHHLEKHHGRHYNSQHGHDTHKY